jgi:hypothetical protein
MLGKYGKGMPLLFLAVLGLCIIATTLADENQAVSYDKNITIIIVGHPQLGNLTYCDGCCLKGEAVDRLEAALRKMVYNVIRYCAATWGEALEMTKEYNNVIVACGFWDEDRASKYWFTVGNGYVDSIVCYTLAGSNITIKSVDDLKNLTGVTTANDSYAELNSKLATLNIKRYVRVEDCLTALVNGEVDYYIASDQVDVIVNNDEWKNVIKGPEIARLQFRCFAAKNTIIDINALNTTLERD